MRSEDSMNMKLKSLFLFFGIALSGALAPVHAQVSDQLKERLIGVENGKIVDFELSGTAEYYVFYHSASW